MLNSYNLKSVKELFIIKIKLCQIKGKVLLFHIKYIVILTNSIDLLSNK